MNGYLDTPCPWYCLPDWRWIIASKGSALVKKHWCPHPPQRHFDRARLAAMGLILDVLDDDAHSFYQKFDLFRPFTKMIP